MIDSVEPVAIRGRYFWRGDKRFQLRGVVYQLRRDRKDGYNTVTDPLSDERLEELERSLPMFQELGLNAIFIYSIDSSRNHDKAMKLLSRAGIYVLVCLSTPQICINRNAPRDSYTSILLREYFRVIDCMAAYPNTLGVIVANSLINTVSSTNVASTIRAVSRDVKIYMSIAANASGQRVLPIGVSSSGTATLLTSEFDYMTGGPQEEAVDFFCFNNYLWCGESSMRVSGYENLVRRFSDTHVPVFFSEYGANVYTPRTFHETRAIFSPEMTGTFSGGFVYEFFQGANRYGLVKAHQGELWERLGDFENLKKRLETCTDLPDTLQDWGSEQVTMTKRPELPVPSEIWRCDSKIPDSPVDWDEVTGHIVDKQWVDVEHEIQNPPLISSGSAAV